MINFAPLKTSSLKKRISLFLLLAFLAIILPTKSFAGDKEPETLPVICNLVKKNQPDDLGYNAVSGLAYVLYKGIMEGKIKLWDSNKKKINLLPETLRAVENTSHSKFTDVENVFVYEYWNISAKEIKVRTAGFEFAKTGEGKDAISYGFIDYNEAAEWIRNSFIPANADGFSHITVDYVLRARQYNYQLIQYGAKVVKSFDESERIRKSTFEKLDYKPGHEAIRQDKHVSYLIVPNYVLKDDPKIQYGNVIINAFEDYLNTNLVDLLNMKHSDFNEALAKNPQQLYKINKIEVHETWHKNEDYISYLPDSVTLTINEITYPSIKFAYLNQWQMVIDFKSLEDVLKEKQYFFIINGINAQAIGRSKAYDYDRALYNADWKLLNIYVNR